MPKKELAVAAGVCAGLVVVALVAAIIFQVNMTRINLPDRWGDFRRTAYTSGQDALAGISALHCQTVDVQHAYRADYAGPGERFTVWVAVTAGSPQAYVLQSQITDHVGTVDRVFSAPELVRRGGLTAHRSTGMGLTHFYYVKAGAVYLVAVSAGNPDDLIMRIILDL